MSYSDSSPEKRSHFQQDKAPAHRTHDPVEYSSQHAPAFVPLRLWKLNCPDLNSVDYEVWACRRDELINHRVLSNCHRFDHRAPSWAFRQWHVRLPNLSLIGNFSFVSFVVHVWTFISRKQCKGKLLKFTSYWYTQWTIKTWHFIFDYNFG